MFPWFVLLSCKEAGDIVAGAGYGHLVLGVTVLELETKTHEAFTTFQNLLRNYAKQSLTYGKWMSNI